MTLIVNGIDYTPDLVGYTVNIEPIGQWERNAYGRLVGDLIAYKSKLSLSWGILKADKFSLLLNSLAPFFVTVQYDDPKSNAVATSDFYASPRTGSLAFIDTEGVNWWRDVSFNLIER